MSRIIVQQANERQLDTIRVRVMEQSIWRQGWDSARNAVRWFRECRNRLEMHGNVRKCTKLCKGWGIEFTEFRFEYFCLDYVSKIGVSVTERNSIPPSRTSSRGPIEIHGKFGLGLNFGCC